MDTKYMFSVRVSDITNYDGTFEEWEATFGKNVTVVYSVHKIPYLPNGELDFENMEYPSLSGYWLGTKYIITNTKNEVVWAGLNPAEMITYLIENFV